MTRVPTERDPRFRIIDLANERGITIFDVAIKAAVAPGRMYNIVNNHGQNPTLDTLQAIAGALDVPVADLFAREKSA